MNPEPTTTHRRLSRTPECFLRRAPWIQAMTSDATSSGLPDRLFELAAELRPQAPQWADRLAAVTSEQELLQIVADLLNLRHALTSSRKPAASPSALSTRISAFMGANLHKGVTLKLLARFLGYSEKYCSDLFQATMGETFSEHLRRRRLETAIALLTTTDRAVADIATATGFSDQFAFSHFFKRATGHSPVQFRSRQRRPCTTPWPWQEPS